VPKSYIDAHDAAVATNGKETMPATENLQLVLDNILIPFKDQLLGDSSGYKLPSDTTTAAQWVTSWGA
jgi:hypothetical protein